MHTTGKTLQNVLILKISHLKQYNNILKINILLWKIYKSTSIYKTYAPIVHVLTVIEMEHSTFYINSVTKLTLNITV